MPFTIEVHACTVTVTCMHMPAWHMHVTINPTVWVERLRLVVCLQLIHGGRTNEQYFQDVWAFNLETLSWEVSPVWELVEVPSL